MKSIQNRFTRIIAVTIFLFSLFGGGLPVSAQSPIPGNGAQPGVISAPDPAAGQGAGLRNAADFLPNNGEMPSPSQVFAFHPGQAQPTIALSDPNLVAGTQSLAAPGIAAAVNVDDSENSDPTGWAVYEHQTPAQVLSTAGSTLRAVDLYVENPNPPYALTATYVSNSGSYAKTWWLIVDVTPTALLNFAVANSARITSLKTFNDPSVGGSVKFFAVLISNTGADAKGWWFYQGQSIAQLTALWQANSARIVQVNDYMKGATKYYAAVMVDNTGANNRDWWWYVDATIGQLTNSINANNARLIDLDIDPATGNYNAVMTSCSSGCPLWWWYVGIATSDLLNITAQDGARIIDAQSTSGCGDRCWSFVLINNSNAITSRVGQMLRATDGTKGLYLKQVNGPVLASLLDGTIFEPASTIKVAVHLYTARQLQAGSVTETSSIAKFSPPVSGSCPGNVSNGSESILTADQEMMFHSDNTRTRELADYFGTANINLMLNSVGASHTAINHIIGCGGPPENQTTLDDLGVIYEGVANAILVNPTYRSYFFDHEAGKAQFKAEGYDWTGLWSTDIPNLINQEAPPGMPAAVKAQFRNRMELAYKAGSYKICPNGNCSTYKDHISIFGYVSIPTCSAPWSNQYVFGTYIYNSTSDLTSSQAFNATKAELLREQIHNGLATFASCAYNTYLPDILH